MVMHVLEPTGRRIENGYGINEREDEACMSTRRITHQPFAQEHAERYIISMQFAISMRCKGHHIVN
jgi:hypothetical protein